jgi:hypothetical protein
MFNLFKPDLTDLVDPLLDMGNNLNIIDQRIFGLTQYRFSTDDAPDMTGMENGWKVYDTKSGRIKYYYYNPLSGNGPQLLNIPKVNNTYPWNTISLINGYVAAASNNGPNIILDAPAWRYMDGDNTRIQLKGRMVNTGGIVNNTSIQIAADGSVPNAVGNRYFSIQPGVGDSNPESNSAARIQVSNTGGVYMVHYGTSNTGSVENYICLDGVIYSTV